MVWPRRRVPGLHWCRSAALHQAKPCLPRPPLLQTTLMDCLALRKTGEMLPGAGMACTRGTASCQPHSWHSSSDAPGSDPLQRPSAVALIKCLLAVASIAHFPDLRCSTCAGGRITGDIRINGHPQRPETFMRVMGYVEQTDVHMVSSILSCIVCRPYALLSFPAWGHGARGRAVVPRCLHDLCLMLIHSGYLPPPKPQPEATVHEALLFSARLRLPASVPSTTTDNFVEEVGALDLGFDVLCMQRLRGCLHGS